MKKERRVIIPRKVYEKMMFMACVARPCEIQFLGEVEDRSTSKKNEFIITDVHCLRQSVSGGSTDFDLSSIAQFVTTHPAPEKVWAWIHSHVDMNTFWSATDTSTIKRLVGSMGRLLSIVFNLSGDMKARLDISLKFYNVHNSLRSEIVWLIPKRMSFECAVEVGDSLSDEEKKVLEEEVREKVSRAAVFSSGQLLGSPKRMPLSSSNPSKDCWFCKYSKMFVVNGKVEFECSNPSGKGSFSNNGECSGFVEFRDGEEFSLEPKSSLVSSVCVGCVHNIDNRCVFGVVPASGDDLPDGCLYRVDKEGEI